MPQEVEQGIAGRLCLACGLCCNGVLFKDVELQAGDSVARLQAGGLKLERLKTKIRFPQPCAALCADNRCEIYPERPARCRAFECRLFQRVATGQCGTETALRHIRQARRCVDRVRKLLRQLGDTNESAPLSARFRRTCRHMETADSDKATSETFAELTLAMQDLNLMLGRHFRT